MNKQVTKMYLDEGQLDRDRRYFKPDGPSYVYFRDDEQHRTTDFFYEDWLSMGSPKEIVITIEPADSYQEQLKQTEEILARRRVQSERTEEVLTRSKEVRAKVEPLLRKAGLIK